MKAQIITGDCADVMKGMAENSVDAIVTDPPAGIFFMQSNWDHDKGGRDHWIAWMQTVAAEAIKVLKPGGHALVWSLPRTSHWTATAWENAGFEIRDCISHVFSSGMPKSRDIGKAIDSEAGHERGMSLDIRNGANTNHATKGVAQIVGGSSGTKAIDEGPITEAAKHWDGFGSGLKPSVESWWLLRKPLSKGLTIAANVLQYGTGGLNIGACRIPMDTQDHADYLTKRQSFGNTKTNSGSTVTFNTSPVLTPEELTKNATLGRWPANICTDGSEQVLVAFPSTHGAGAATNGKHCAGKNEGHRNDPSGFQYGGAAHRFGDSGSAARFFAQFPPDDLNGESRIFYTAKASQADRNSGLQGERNPHNTVKPQSLCRYLCRLITPPGGTVLDMFAGSGSTGKAAMMEGFDFIGIEQDAAMAKIARHRTTGAAPLFVEMTEAA